MSGSIDIWYVDAPPKWTRQVSDYEYVDPSRGEHYVLWRNRWCIVSVEALSFFVAIDEWLKDDDRSFTWSYRDMQASTSEPPKDWGTTTSDIGGPMMPNADLRWRAEALGLPADAYEKAAEAQAYRDGGRACFACGSNEEKPLFVPDRGLLCKTCVSELPLSERARKGLTPYPPPNEIKGESQSVVAMDENDTPNGGGEVLIRNRIDHYVRDSEGNPHRIGSTPRLVINNHTPKLQRALEEVVLLPKCDKCGARTSHGERDAGGWYACHECEPLTPRERIERARTQPPGFDGPKGQSVAGGALPFDPRGTCAKNLGGEC